MDAKTKSPANEYKGEGFFYDDDAYLTFNHPTDGAQAASETSQDVFDIGHVKVLARINEDRRNLTKSDKAMMNDDEIENYEFNRKMLESIWPQMKEKLQNYQAYEDTWHILETDYDNYAMFWKCLQKEELFNAAGESQ